ncbi:MAG: M14 family zinc carboxypeptidase [Bacteroidales bacterium]
MVRIVAILLLLSGLLPRLCHSQEIPEADRVRSLIAKYGQAEVKIITSGRIDLDRLTRNVSIARFRDNVITVILSRSTAGWFLAQGYNFTVAEETGSKGIINSENVASAMQWETYPSYPQYDSIMRYFASAYPLLCRLDTIGTSIRGKLVLALRISGKTGAHEAQPAVFYSSTIHGDETGGFVLMLRLADYLLKNYYLDNTVKDLVDNLEIWINPLANPDGTYNSGDFIVSPVRTNANGVDLNRNFPDPELPVTLRQKETLDMMSFLGKHRFVLSANFHSGEEVVNYPWDRWERAHADQDWFNSISRSYADTAHLYAPDGYMKFLDNGVTNGYAWYPVFGGRQDYVTYSLQGREVTIELDNNFITPAAELGYLWEYNRRSLTGYLGNALYGIHGIVKDSETSAPVPSKIFIEDHDKDNSWVYSDSVTGSFTRFLAPGTWKLTVSSDGYITGTVTSVDVTSLNETFLTIELKKIINQADTSTAPFIYPNPGRDFVRAILPGSVRGTVNVKIFNPAGQLLADYDTEAISGSPVLTDIRNFSAGTYIVVYTSKATGRSYRGRIIVLKRN